MKQTPEQIANDIAREFAEKNGLRFAVSHSSLGGYFKTMFCDNQHYMTYCIGVCDLVYHTDNIRGCVLTALEREWKKTLDL